MSNVDREIDDIIRQVGDQMSTMNATVMRLAEAVKARGLGDTGPQGVKGDKGDTGPQGAQGDKGDKGDTGESA